MKNHILEHYFIQSTNSKFSSYGSWFDPKEHEKWELQWRENREETEREYCKT